MPKIPKTKLKHPAQPLAVHATGNPWDPSGAIPATVPLPNEVIITKVNGPYTERDRKLWAFLVAAVWDELLTKETHELRVSKINALFQELGGEKNAAWIWDSVIRLMQTVVEWESGPDADRMAEATQLLSWAGIKKEMRLTGFLRFSIHPSLCMAIRAPCRFSRLRLHFMIGLSGKYAVTLYMLLESVANMHTPVLDVALPQLRQWLKVPEDKLEKWFDLKRFGIAPALKQINSNPEASGFTVAMEEIKEGRAVERVRFVVTKNQARLEEEKNHLPALEPPAYTHPNSQPNTAHLLPTSAYEQARKAAPGWDIYELERQWRDWMQGKPAPANPAGAFVNFCAAKARPPAAPAQPVTRSASEKLADAEKREMDWDELDRAMAWFESLPEETRHTLEMEYLAESNKIDASLFKKKGPSYTGFRLFIKKTRAQVGAG